MKSLNKLLIKLKYYLYLKKKSKAGIVARLTPVTGIVWCVSREGMGICAFLVWY